MAYNKRLVDHRHPCSSIAHGRHDSFQDGLAHDARLTIDTGSEVRARELGPLICTILFRIVLSAAVHDRFIDAQLNEKPNLRKVDDDRASGTMTM